MFLLERGDRVAVKGVTVLEYPIEKVIAFFNKRNVTQLINETVVRYDYLHTDELTNSHIVHMEMRTPWPIDNRDFVLLTTSHKEGPDRYFVAYQSVDYDQPIHDGIVRGFYYPGAYILERLSPNKTRVTVVTDTDLCGSIPHAVVGFMAGRQG